MVFINVRVYISTDVSMLRFVVCGSSHILLLWKNILPFLFFFFFSLLARSLVASPPRVSAADSRYYQDVNISKCYESARSLFIEIATSIQASLYVLCSFRLLLWRQKHRDQILQSLLQEIAVVVACTKVNGAQLLIMFPRYS